ncbi:NAD(P)-dependent oxidoreductase [Nonomuraea sp. NEAU-A123]|uniref:NAD(P)-dependent oxidoreductase n=1 Tax=Nonomuraea sp. NEAU-A123 TaxID=2839649 RepID=UPI001BE4C167|nr:NAD(P)-binding domain-containing protein [Nonomuraea sp. NEAU-A123]MBT2231174.1 NAD(P)-binding domain-containing protein [Nonomuraea sp. NEAU-A123]
MRISILGLGLMGQALARTLVQAGHSVTVWNRTEGKAAGSGATSVATAAEAVEASPLVIVCVLDYAAVREVLGSVQLADRVLLNLTNGRPAEARELAEWVAARGGDYLDGGIMAVPQMIGTPGALVLYSGSQPAFERYEEALGALARPRYLGADAGLAPLYDLAMLTGMYGQIAGFLEAAALIASEKRPVTEFTTELLVPWLTAMAAQQPRWAVDIEAGDYATDVSNLEVNRVGMVNLLRAFEDQGVKPDLLLPMRDLLDRRVAAGHGAQGLSGLIEELR